MWNELNRNAERRVLSIVPNNSELRTYNSELGEAVDSALELLRESHVRLLLWRLFAHGAAEEFGQGGVEGGTGLLLDLLQGFVDREGCSFRFFGGQVIKHLGDADNASEQGRAFFS